MSESSSEVPQVKLQHAIGVGQPVKMQASPPQAQQRQILCKDSKENGFLARDESKNCKVNARLVSCCDTGTNDLGKSCASSAVVQTNSLCEKVDDDNSSPQTLSSSLGSDSEALDLTNSLEKGSKGCCKPQLSLKDVIEKVSDLPSAAPKKDSNIKGGSATKPSSCNTGCCGSGGGKAKVKVPTKAETKASASSSVDMLLNKLEAASLKNVLDFQSAGNVINGVTYKVYESEKQMPDIIRLITKDLSEPYSIYTYRYFIHNWPKLCFLAMVDDVCVGAIVCKLDLHKKMVLRGYIAMLAVDSQYRRRLIGSTLVTKAIQAMIRDDCDEVVLETEITNQGALHLYENLGFVRDKRLFRYYLNGVDALRLKLWLTMR